MLAVGARVSYGALGPGEVVRHETRTPDGAQRTFAVIELPCRDLTVHVALDDPKLAERLRPIVSARRARALLRLAQAPALSADYDRRQRVVAQRLAANDPDAWASVVWGYAALAAGGALLSVSDRERMAEAIERLAAECGYSLGRARSELAAKLRQRAEEASAPAGRRRRAAA